MILSRAHCVRSRAPSWRAHTFAPCGVRSLTLSILIHFPDAGDSPTRSTPLRMRFSIREGVPVLHYSRGRDTLNLATWESWRMAGATLETSSERDANIAGDIMRRLGITL